MDNRDKAEYSILGFVILTIIVAAFYIYSLKGDIDYLSSDKKAMQNRINEQADLIRDMSVITQAYDELIVEHEDLQRDMSFIASISPLRNILTADEITTLLKEVPTGDIFVDAAVVTAPYGISIGYHGKPRSDHRGVDIYPIDPELMKWSIMPLSDGVVETFGENDVYGKFIIVRHSERVRTFYGHLNKIYYAGTTGRKVSNDTMIGVMGNSGMTSSQTKNGGGKHVHFEVQVFDGFTWVSIDPEPFMENIDE